MSKELTDTVYMAIFLPILTIYFLRSLRCGKSLWWNILGGLCFAIGNYIFYWIVAFLYQVFS